MPEPARVVNVDDVQALEGPGTLKWKPIRYELGIRAFGCNAYVAADAGLDVVEPHTESLELAHEELYYVARGRASFTIDGQTYDAPAGTYVFVPDPASHRAAVAREPDTLVLSFGGPPTFEPSPWEWAFRAAAIARSDPAQANQILQDGLATHPASSGLHYQSACQAALEGNSELALERLRHAAELEPGVIDWARSDNDLDTIREHPGFKDLTGEE